MKINYIDLLLDRLTVYKNRFYNRPFYVFIKLIWWSICYLFTKIIKILTLKPPKNKNELFIGIAIGGGLGDILISANYILYFKKYLSPLNVHIDCYSTNLCAAHNILDNSNLVNNIYKNVYNNKAEKYDLYFSVIESFPKVMHFNETKIKKLSPKLFNLVEEYLKNEQIIEKSINYGQKIKSTTYVASLIQGRNRVQVNDVGNLLGIEPVIKFVPSVSINEQECLKKFNLENTKYITINRCVSDTNNFWDSNKMWPLENCTKLVDTLKKNYSAYKIIQIGHSLKRSPVISNVDDCLVGKTTFEEAKVILKKAILHIDGEGGLVHLRHALNRGKSVVMFGPTSPEFYGYPENINIKTNACCHWCDWIIEDWQTHCLNPQKQICMNSITPNMVFEKIKNVLDKTSTIIY